SGAGVGEAHPEGDVVQPQLERLEQVLTGLPLLAVRAVVVETELPLHQTVDPLDLLLLAELDAVLGELDPPLTVLARRVRAPLDRTLVGVAAVPLEVHLHVFAPA